MRPAERVRMGEEGIRPMAYQLIPEVWTRVRPERHITHPRTIVVHTQLYDPASNDDGGWEFPLTPNDMDLQYPPSLSPRQEVGSCSSSSPLSWVALPWRCQPTTTTPIHNHGGWDRRAMATTAVLEYLHKETDYHWSCGAKFGADFLLYDGPRSQRHAFAGLRIMIVPPPPTEEAATAATTSAARGTGVNDPPEDTVRTTVAGAAAGMPSAYELAAYVRCLNTAGKLALLATVVVVTMDNNDNDQAAGERGDHSRENQPPPHHEVTPTTTTIHIKVAFVDVALEKILTAPTHQKYGRSEKRRDVAKNLAKTK